MATNQVTSVMRNRMKEKYSTIDDEDYSSQEDNHEGREGDNHGLGPIVRKENWCSSISNLFTVLVSFTSLVDLFLSWCSSAHCTFLSLERVGEGATDETMMYLGIGRIVHIVIIYGSWATIVPKRELQGPGRKAKMYTQGGHSLMLTYFLGCGAVSEFVRDRCCKEISGILTGRKR
jgi:hypothetical protein